MLEITLASIVAMFSLSDPRRQKSLRWMAEGLYFFCCFTAIALYVSHGKCLDRSMVAVVFVLLNTGIFSHAWMKKNRLLPHDLFISSLAMFMGFYAIMVSENLIAIYVSLELIFFSVLILLLLRSKDVWSIETCFKYLVLNVLSSASLLLSFLAMIYLSSSLQINDFMSYHPVGNYLESAIVILFTLGISVKISSAPIHSAMADIYDSLAPVALALVGILPRFAIFVLLWRLKNIMFLDHVLWSKICVIFAIFSWCIGYFGAIRQHKIMRLLCYMGIAQMGWMWLAWSAASVEALEVSLNFMCLYTLAWLVFVTIIVHLMYRQREILWLDELSGIMQSSANYILAISLFLSIAVMMAVPPFIGFWARFAILRISASFFVSCIGMLFSVIGAFCYLNLIYHAFVRVHYYEVILLDFRGVVLAVILNSILVCLSLYPVYILC